MFYIPQLEKNPDFFAFNKFDISSSFDSTELFLSTNLGYVTGDGGRRSNNFQNCLWFSTKITCFQAICPVDIFVTF